MDRLEKHCKEQVQLKVTQELLLDIPFQAHFPDKAVGLGMKPNQSVVTKLQFLVLIRYLFLRDSNQARLKQTTL